MLTSLTDKETEELIAWISAATDDNVAHIFEKVLGFKDIPALANYLRDYPKYNNAMSCVKEISDLVNKMSTDGFVPKVWVHDVLKNILDDHLVQPSRIDS